MRNRILFSFAILFFLLGNILCSKHILFATEASEAGSFKIFKQSLLKAVKAHDRKFILGITDSNIHLTNMPQGITDFEKYLGNDFFWIDFQRILTLGEPVKNNPTGFCYDYVVVKNGTKVRDRLGPDAKIIETLNADVFIPALPMDNKELQYTDKDQHKKVVGMAEYLKVITPRGKQGFIKGDDIVNPFSSCAEFKKVKGKWKMTAFEQYD